MLKTQAEALVALLAASYPQAPIEAATVEVYVASLRKLNRAETGRRAVEQLIEAEPWLPSIAQIRVAYLALRRREEEQAQRAIPPPADPEEVRELPEVAQELLRRWSSPDETAPLPDAGSGRCDDCGQDGARVTVGSRSVCGSCARSRLRVQAAIGA